MNLFRAGGRRLPSGRRLMILIAHGPRDATVAARVLHSEAERAPEDGNLEGNGMLYLYCVSPYECPVHQSCIIRRRGLASFLANHPISDLVPVRLISVSDLSAEILELWAKHQCSDTRTRSGTLGSSRSFTSVDRPFFLSCHHDAAHRERGQCGASSGLSHRAEC
jgi:hypothetical protein